MTDRTDPRPALSDAEDALAAELAMGLLEGAERQAAEARAAADPAFRAAVAAWSERLAPLAADLPGRPPPERTLAAIEMRLGWSAPPPGRATARPGARLARGIPLLLAAAAAALLLLAVLPAFLHRLPAPLATVAAADGSLRFELRADPASGTLRIVRVAGAPAPAGQVHELWLLAPGAAPVSLGLIGDGPLVVDYPPPPAGWGVAVSLEPEGGSPTGAPTGPVLARGEITRL